MKREFEEAQVQFECITSTDIITSSGFWGDLEEDEDEDEGTW